MTVPETSVTAALPSPKSTVYVSGRPQEPGFPMPGVTDTLSGPIPLDDVAPLGMGSVSCRSKAPRSYVVCAPVPVSATRGSSTRGAPFTSVAGSPGASASAESITGEFSSVASGYA
ncbi:hypothetical protein [Streptomyces sp. SAI-126]|uniref:hypothetical protein n=1 Tax=Streptomyces sp. SAI-126 TaxID=3377732 RepID=UPI003C7BF058